MPLGGLVSSSVTITSPGPTATLRNTTHCTQCVVPATKSWARPSVMWPFSQNDSILCFLESLHLEETNYCTRSRNVFLSLSVCLIVCVWLYVSSQARRLLILNSVSCVCVCELLGETYCYLVCLCVEGSGGVLASR